MEVITGIVTTAGIVGGVELLSIKFFAQASEIFESTLIENNSLIDENESLDPYSVDLSAFQNEELMNFTFYGGCGGDCGCGCNDNACSECCGSDKCSCCPKNPCCEGPSCNDFCTTCATASLVNGKYYATGCVRSCCPYAILAVCEMCTNDPVGSSVWHCCGCLPWRGDGFHGFGTNGVAVAASSASNANTASVNAVEAKENIEKQKKVATVNSEELKKMISSAVSSAMGSSVQASAKHPSFHQSLLEAPNSIVSFAEKTEIDTERNVFADLISERISKSITNKFGNSIAEKAAKSIAEKSAKIIALQEEQNKLGSNKFTDRDAKIEMLIEEIEKQIARQKEWEASQYKKDQEQKITENAKYGILGRVKSAIF